ncbi:hypothetical protein LCGC14_2317010, partial [marine sediment metagenome]
MNEFIVNKYITLKLENKKTILYLNGEYFRQCMSLMLNITKNSLKSNDSINNLNSIDEIADSLKTMEDNSNNKNNKILPEQEFQAHCSNLQAWVENDYNTRILHKNIAFPLLKRLTEAGDLVAKKVFKNEIVERCSSRYPPVSNYLIKENYLNYFTTEEQVTLIKSMDIREKNLFVLAWILKKNLYHYFDENFITGLGNRNEILNLRLNGIKPSQWPRLLEDLPNLEGLALNDNKLAILPNSIGNLKNLKELYLINNQLIKLPESIGNLTSLRVLFLRDNKIIQLPKSIGSLKNLTHFYLINNQLNKLPKSIGNLISLRVLSLRDNKIT